MLREQWRAVKRLLVIRLDNIGDIILLSSAVRAVKEELPAVSITLMSSPAGAEAAPLIPGVDDIIICRAVWQDAFGRMPLDSGREQLLIRQLQEQRFDAVLIFTSFSQGPHVPGYVCYLAEIPLRAAQTREFSGSVFTDWVKPLPDDAHQAARNLHLLRSLGFAVRNTELELRIPPDDELSARAALERVGLNAEEPYVVLAPGASCDARRYDAGEFLAAAYALARKSGYPLLIVGTAAEGKQIRTVAKERSVIPFFGQTTVPQLAAVIKNAALVIANNSAAMHIADVYRRPLVVVYSGTDYVQQWRPQSSPLRLLRRATVCTPCYRFTCPFHKECLAVAPEEIVRCSLELLAGTGLGGEHKFYEAA